MKLLAKVDRRWEHREAGEVVLLDNRDSFVYNLAHRFFELGQRVVVVRSDSVSLEELIAWQPRALVVSPGPGHPDEAGVSVESIRHFCGQVPILGVCLGHQAIATAFGGVVEASGRPRHGKSSMVEHDGLGLFAGLANPVEVGRYHSLVVREPVVACLEITARADGFVMGLAHREHPTFGVQFHPESVLTPAGYGLLQNFLKVL
ncbi:MAG: aminodeoxychorismate/anthranilate synthase component II [Bradymonadaceae bacterium]|nr:aminodeoxychorismate/anthranilate synthase component II [Lujinxingiaceae bacterium]